MLNERFIPQLETAIYTVNDQEIKSKDAIYVVNSNDANGVAAFNRDGRLLCVIAASIFTAGDAIRFLHEVCAFEKHNGFGGQLDVNDLLFTIRESFSTSFDSSQIPRIDAKSFGDNQFVPIYAPFAFYLGFFDYALVGDFVVNGSDDAESTLTRMRSWPQGIVEYPYMPARNRVWYTGDTPNTGLMQFAFMYHNGVKAKFKELSGWISTYGSLPCVGKLSVKGQYIVDFTKVAKSSFELNTAFSNEQFAVLMPNIDESMLNLFDLTNEVIQLSYDGDYVPTNVGTNERFKGKVLIKPTKFLPFGDSGTLAIHYSRMGFEKGLDYRLDAVRTIIPEELDFRAFIRKCLELDRQELAVDSGLTIGITRMWFELYYYLLARGKIHELRNNEKLTKILNHPKMSTSNWRFDLVLQDQIEGDVDETDYQSVEDVTGLEPGMFANMFTAKDDLREDFLKAFKADAPMQDLISQLKFERRTTPMVMRGKTLNINEVDYFFMH